MQDFFGGVRQGQVLGSPAIGRWFDDLEPVPTLAAVVSQTCDVVLDKRPTIAVAPVVALEGQQAALARNRDTPRYIHLPAVGDGWFADLSYVRSFKKEQWPTCTVQRGIGETDESVRAFALAVGRWFARFAFPNDVVPFLQPLQGIVRQKYSKPQSDLGMVLHDVVEIRVQAEQWSRRPLSLTLHVVVRAGVVPTLAAGGAPCGDVIDDLRRQAPAELATSIRVSKEPARKALAWQLFAEALAAQGRADQAGAVDEVTGLLWSDDEFPMSLMRKSEALDLDYLSPGYPV